MWPAFINKNSSSSNKHLKSNVGGFVFGDHSLGEVRIYKVNLSSLCRFKKKKKFKKHPKFLLFGLGEVHGMHT